MTRKPLIALAVAAVLAAVVGGWWIISRPDPADNGLILSGNVDVRQVDLSFRVEGRLAKLLVEEGDTVSAGQVVAELDDGYLKDAVRVTEARVAAQEAQLAKLEAGNRPQEIAQAKAELEKAEAALNNARVTYNRRAGVELGATVSRQALDDARNVLRQAEAQAARARQTLDLQRQGFREEDITIGRAQLDGEKATMDLMRRRLADAVLTSPANGIVMTRVREPGAMTLPGATIATLALMNPMQVRTWVAEPDLGRAVPGTTAEIVTDGGKTYHGQVGFVSPVAEFTPKAVETRELRTSLVYRLRIVVDDADDGLRQGMPVTVRLLPSAPK